MLARRHEQRKVLTLIGESPWREGSDVDAAYTAVTTNQAFGRMNKEVNRLAQVVTVHSSSSTHVVFRYPGTLSTQRLYTTVVYSGEIDIVDHFSECTDSLGNPLQPDTTIVCVWP